MNLITEDIKLKLKEIDNLLIEIENKHINELWEKASKLVYEKLTSELFNIVTLHPDKAPKDIPEAADIIIAVSVLKKYYPRLN